MNVCVFSGFCISRRAHLPRPFSLAWSRGPTRMSIKTQCLSPHFFTLVESFQRFQDRKKGSLRSSIFGKRKKKRFHPLTSYIGNYIEIEIEFIYFHAFSSKIIESIKWIWYLRSRKKYKVEKPIEPILHSRFGKCRIWE